MARARAARWAATAPFGGGARPRRAWSFIPARGAPAGVRFLEHTADIGIEVKAPTIEACFARAAAGMFACSIGAPPRAAPLASVEVDVAAGTSEELMVAWLEELLYRSEVDGLAPHEFVVDSMTKTRLRGRARGARFGSGARTIGHGVKAVTRHGLEVRPTGNGWRARLIFDV